MSYEQGQTVVIERYRRYGGGWHIAGTGTVDKIWKNGVVAVKDGKHTVGTFHPDGQERGGACYFNLPGRRIRPLAEGETAGLIAHALKVSAEAANVAEGKKSRQRELDIERWWDETGLDIWNSRVPIEGGLMGREVCVIRFDSRGEKCLAFLLVEEEDMPFGSGRSYNLISGGVSGREYEDGQQYISTYSSGMAGGRTMHEALYELCR